MKLRKDIWVPISRSNPYNFMMTMVTITPGNVMGKFEGFSWFSSFWGFDLIQVVPYNFVFLFNVGPEFFLCNDGEIWTKFLLNNDISSNWLLSKKYIQPVQNKNHWLVTKCCSDNITLAFFLCNVVWSLLDNIAYNFFCAMLSWES